MAGLAIPSLTAASAKARFRADQLIEKISPRQSRKRLPLTVGQMSRWQNILKPISCVVLAAVPMILPMFGSSNLMYKTFQGVTEDAKSEVYLRPKQPRGIFVNLRM